MNQSNSKHNSRQNIISACILVFGTLAAYLLLGPHSSRSQDTGKGNKPVPVVKTMVLGDNKTSGISLHKTVTLKANGNSADAVAQFSGRIKDVNFEVGQNVSEGQVLAVFDQSALENSPKVALESAEKSLKIAQDSLDRTKEVADSGIDLAESAVKVAKIQYNQAKDSKDNDKIKLAKEALELAELQKDQAEQSAKLQENGAHAQLVQAQQGLQQARLAYDKTLIKAPISGVVVSKSVATEDTLNPGQKVAEIVGAGKVEAVLYVSDAEADRMQQGDEVKIMIGQDSVKGKILSLSTMPSEANQRYEVKIVSKDQAVKYTDKTAEVEFNLHLAGEQGQQHFFVPMAAINISQTGKQVYLVSDGKVSVKEVETGDILDSMIEVTSGLLPGQEIIIDNNRTLQAGQEVKIENS